MKIRNALASAETTCAMAATLAVLAAGGQQGQEQKVQPHPDGYGMTTNPVGISKGQRAHLIIWNQGKEPILVRLQFVNPQGEKSAPVRRDVNIQPGKAEAVNAYHPGGADTFEFRAQYGTKEKGSLGLLAPKLLVTDEQAGGTAREIGAEGFVAVPIYMN